MTNASCAFEPMHLITLKQTDTQSVNACTVALVHSTVHVNNSITPHIRTYVLYILTYCMYCVSDTHTHATHTHKHTHAKHTHTHTQMHTHTHTYTHTWMHCAVPPLDCMFKCLEGLWSGLQERLHVSQSIHCRACRDVGQEVKGKRFPSHHLRTCNPLI